MRDGKYSQNDEDFIIREYFGSKVHGTFLSIGENDGVTFSNVRVMAEKGWKGVMVEPSPKAYEKLVALYKGFKGFYTYNVALSNHNGNAILHESGPLCSAQDVALVSTFHAHEMDRFKKSVTYEPITVKCFTWKTFLNRLSIKQFDLISIDVEGEEMNILPDMNLDQTSVVVIEWNSKPELKVEYEKYLAGFRLIYTSAENLIYAR
jgi:FkbM family methyltransferase